MQSSTIAALYVRLSSEDLNRELSKSIENQIIGLKDYAKKQNIAIFDVYIDDGYSGSNFDRPSFKNMITDMELKKFNTIIIKDLSRLGRNFVHVGNYIEHIFPDNNIRLISVDDNYDSLTYDDDESIVLRSFLNDYYLKECKKKAKLAVEKRSKNKYMSTGGIYGFKYDENKNIIIDPIPAKNVQTIFDMFLNGHTIKEIVNRMNEEHHPTPGYQCTLNYGDNRYRLTEDQYYNWKSFMIIHILKNIEYTGVAINRIMITKNGKQVKNDNPIILENKLEPLITKEQFDKVQEIFKSNEKNYTDNLDDYRIKGLFYCAKCNKPMQYADNRIERNKSVYVCRLSKTRANALILHEVVYKDLIAVLTEFKSNPTKFKRKYEKHLFSQYDLNRYNVLTKTKNQIDANITKLFEMKLMGEISEAKYKEKLVSLKEENQNIESELLRYDSYNLDKKILAKRFETFEKSLHEYENITDKLELIRKFVSKVIVSNDEVLKLNIIYKFDIRV